METVIEAVGIGKRFGGVTALQDVGLAVPRGTVLGLLGHNGAGKTTLVNVLATLVGPTSGRARVSGFDVVDQAHQVRSRIGLTGQFAAVDEQISGRDNLMLIARLLGAGRRGARRRTDELLELFDLTLVAGRQARTYSGGMRRRLDLAASLVGRPEVVFLDEPTTGLDPAVRLNMWRVVRMLTWAGSTVLLTTQNLEEADRLADWIIVLSAGRVIASGTPAELKARIGQRTVTAGFSGTGDLLRASHALYQAGLEPRCDRVRRTATVSVAATRDVAAIVRVLDQAAVEADELTMTEPGLDEAYLALTGQEC